jgi:ADP-ribosylation factor-like protein 1
MGLIFSRLFAALFGQKEVRILILGLDNAGSKYNRNNLYIDN